MADKMLHAELLAAFELRFDFQSSRNVLAELLTLSEVGERADYDKAAVEALATVLVANYTNTDRLLNALTSAFEPPAPLPEAIPAPVDEAVVLEGEEPARGRKKKDVQ
jgi:hypothetical protein